MAAKTKATPAKATPADAKAAWEAMKNPSVRKVAEKLKAAGKDVSFKTIGLWKRKGWPGTKPETPGEAAKNIEKAKEGMNLVAGVITGDPAANSNDVIKKIEPVQVPEGANSALTENAYRELMHEARLMMGAVLADFPRLLEASGAETLAKTLSILGAAITIAHDGLARIADLRAAEMKDVPGTVEVLPPVSEQTAAKIAVIDRAIAEHQQNAQRQIAV